MYRAKILNKKSINRGNTFHQKRPILKNKIVEKFIPNERYVLNIERNNPVETFNKKVHAIAKYQTKVIIFGKIRSSQLMLRTYLWSKGPSKQLQTFDEYMKENILNGQNGNVKPFVNISNQFGQNTAWYS